MSCKKSQGWETMWLGWASMLLWFLLQWCHSGIVNSKSLILFPWQITGFHNFWGFPLYSSFKFFLKKLLANNTIGNQFPVWKFLVINILYLCPGSSPVTELWTMNWDQAFLNLSIQLLNCREGIPFGEGRTFALESQKVPGSCWEEPLNVSGNLKKLPENAS